MPYKKGDSKPNTSGRKPGTKNKVKTEIKQKIVNLWDDNEQQIKDDLKALTPNQRMSWWAKILPLIVPRPTAEDNKPQEEGEFNAAKILETFAKNN